MFHCQIKKVITTKYLIHNIIQLCCHRQNLIQITKIHFIWVKTNNVVCKEILSKKEHTEFQLIEMIWNFPTLTLDPIFMIETKKFFHMLDLQLLHNKKSWIKNFNLKSLKILKSQFIRKMKIKTMFSKNLNKKECILPQSRSKSQLKKKSLSPLNRLSETVNKF